MDNSVIEIKALTKYYGEQKGCDASFIYKGEISAIISRINELSPLYLVIAVVVTEIGNFTFKVKSDE